MMFRQFLLAVTLSIVGLTASAQTTGTSVPLTGNWNNVITGAHPNNCCTGGPAPLYDPATGIIHFSYGNTAVHRVIAINQALSGSGVQINGYNWGYDLRNMNGAMGGQGGTDSIVATTFMTNRFNQFLVQDDRHYNTQFDWTRFSGTVGLPSRLSLEDAGSLGIQFVSRDSGFWGGYYGPQVRNVEMTVNYTVDPCAGNPRSSPSCAGYNDAWSSGNLASVYGNSFAINQALEFGNSGVRVHSATWGYDYNIGGQWCSSVFLGMFCTEWSDSYVGGSLNITNNNNQQIAYDTNSRSGRNISGSFRREILLGSTSPDISSLGNATINTWAGGIASVTPFLEFNFSPDVCSSNPLANPQCPGYQQAYFNQQCSANPLYNNQCPNYAQAFLAQQCSINTLYDPACPGYATAYYNYQCSASALYHTGCPGYAQAYFDQQCSLNTLYNESCPGYAAAYFNQQCSSDPLYNNQCPGYADAYYVQQCTANPLYDSGCDGYAQAYFDQQCELDALYNNQCPGYSEAYALKYVVVSAPAAETTATEPETVVVAQVTVAETKEVTVAATATETAPAATVSASPAAAATAPVSLVAAPAPAPAAPAAEKKAEAKTETKTETAATGGASESKSKPTTTRQALAQRRLEAAREKAAESANANPGAVSSQMDSAASMEQQAELQNVVLGAMGFVAGFDAYGRVNLQDAVGYKPFEIYRGQRNVDSAASRGLLGRSDRIHQDMVDSQYKK